MPVNNNFKNKKIIGLSASALTVGSIGSLGLASRIITSDGENVNSNLNLNTGNLSETNITISSASLNGNINFDSYYNDLDGDITSEIDSSENLEISFTGILNNYSLNWGEIHFNIQVESNYKIILDNLISKQYIELPKFENLTKNNEEKISDDEGTYWRAPLNNNSRSFSTIARFSWGKFFCNVNPSVFFDSSLNNGFKSGNEYTNDEIKNILNEIHSINGAKYTFYIDSMNDNNSYQIDFNSNGGKFTDFDVGNDIFFDKLVLHDSIILPTPYKSGNAFLYWEYNGKQYKSNSKLYLNDIFTIDSNNRKATFNAVWEDISASGVVSVNVGETSAISSFDILIDSQFNAQKTLNFSNNTGGNITDVVIGDTITITNKRFVDKITYTGLEYVPSSDKYIIREKSFSLEIVPSKLSTINFEFKNTINSKIPDNLISFMIYDSANNSSTIVNGSTSSIETSLNSNISIRILHGLDEKISTTGLLADSDGTYKVLSSNCKITFEKIKSFNLTFTKKAVDKTKDPDAEYYIENLESGFKSEYFTVDPVSSSTSVGYVLCPGDTLNVNKGNDCSKIFINSIEASSIDVENSDITVELEGTEECVVRGTKILLSNWQETNVEFLKIGDYIKAYDFKEARIVDAKIIYFKEIKQANADLIKLYFDGHTSLEISGGQSFFSLKFNKFVVIDINNVSDFIGEEFIICNKNCEMVKTKLQTYKIIHKKEDVYELVTEYHYNFFANMLLTCEPLIASAEIFKFKPNTLQYDITMMIDDIKRYGVYSYEECGSFCTKQQFDLYNVKFLKIPVSKGLLKLEYIIDLVNKFKEYSI